MNDGGAAVDTEVETREDRRNACTARLGQAGQVVAHLSAGRQVGLDYEGDGRGNVSSVPEGIDCSRSDDPDGCSAVFAQDEMVILNATEDAPSRFNGWSVLSDCIGTETCTITPGPDPVTVRADFEVNRLVVTPAGINNSPITVLVNGAPTTTCDASSSCELLFDPISTPSITLQTTVADDRRFVGWFGVACQLVDLDCTFVLDRDVAAIGLFEQRPLVTVLVGFGGIVNNGLEDCPTPMNASMQEPCLFHVDLGTTVTLRSIPTDAKSETLWTGCPSQPTAPFVETCTLPIIQK